MSTYFTLRYRNSLNYPVFFSEIIRNFERQNAKRNVSKETIVFRRLSQAEKQKRWQYRERFRRRRRSKR